MTSTTNGGPKERRSPRAGIRAAAGLGPRGQSAPGLPPASGLPAALLGLVDASALAASAATCGRIPVVRVCGGFWGRGHRAAFGWACRREPAWHTAAGGVCVARPPGGPRGPRRPARDPPTSHEAWWGHKASDRQEAKSCLFGVFLSY